MSAQLQQPTSSPELQSPEGVLDTTRSRSRTFGGVSLVIIGLLLLVRRK